MLKIKINEGYNNFLVGTHGEFDEIAFSCCRELKKVFSKINVYVVLTSLVQLNRKNRNFTLMDYYKEIGFETCIYDIEHEHFKRK